MMGKSPLDMAQYKKIFGTCRIPGEKCDKLSFNDSKYVTVCHNNSVSLKIVLIRITFNSLTILQNCSAKLKM